MTRRSETQIERETIVAERAGVLALANERRRAFDQLVARGKMTADDAEPIKRALRAFAGDIAIGLHVAGDDDPEIRVAMQPVVKAAADG